jgi:NADH-quinone oxidoreductase subunit G
MAIIEINGKTVEAEAGQALIEVMDAIGIQVPRFCYHKKLSVAANCRMCLVEVEKSPKLLPACATPITDGMKIQSRSPKVLQAQKSVLEFLLLNHPLDCPICDQGGECELQDVSMGYGMDFSRYEEEKRIIEDKNLGPLIQSDMTRCIHCTRCVRFGQEIAGIRELGGIGRGEDTSIGTFLEQAIHSEVSANVIDLCPVGALTSKPFRYTARAWELKQMPTIAAHDGVGSPLYAHVRDQRIVRVVPQENASINATWIADRDRFSYEALYTDRLMAPKIKINQMWESVSWEKAIDYTTHKLLKVIQETGPHSLGALVSPNATVEEAYLLQHWVRGLGSQNIDHRLRQSDFRVEESLPLLPGLGMDLETLSMQSAVLLVGSHISKEQPIVALSLRQMVLSGGHLCLINPMDFPFNMAVAHKTIVEGGQIALGLARLLKALLEQSQSPLPPSIPILETLIIDAQDRKMASCLKMATKPLIILGSLATSHPQYTEICILTGHIATLIGATQGALTEGSNSAGAWLMGCLPHRLAGGRPIDPLQRGLTTQQMAERALKAYILFNIELEDCIFAHQLLEAFKQASTVIVMTPFESPALLEMADILLPMSPFTESAGTRINMEGRWQSFEACHAPLADSRPGWHVLSALSKASKVGSDYNTIADVLMEAKKHRVIENSTYSVSQDLCVLETLKPDALIRIAPLPLYAADGILRRAAALQQTADAGQAALYLNTVLADRLGLKQGSQAWVHTPSGQWLLPCIIDESIPNGSVMIPQGLEKTRAIGLPYAKLRIDSREGLEHA